MDWIKILQTAEETIKKQGLEKADLPRILGINSQYLTDIRSGKKKSASSGFALSLITKLNFNPVWIETGEGPIYNSPPPEKHPIIADLDAFVDKKLEKLESRVAELENRLEKSGMFPAEYLGPDIYDLEWEPEYDFRHIKAPFVENIAAGRPIYQSDDQSVITVPRRLIRTNPRDYYVGRIKGTSMTAAGIPDGCLALFRISDAPRDGAIQVVAYKGEATVKRMREVPGKGWEICFEDGSNQVIPIGPGDEFHIQGDFVAILPEYLKKTIRPKPTGEVQESAGK